MNTSDYRRLGASGMLVSPLGLGTMQFGWTCDEAASFAVMDAFWEANGNFIDTADCYTAWSQDMGGSPNPGGVSEEIIGRWMKARNNRDDIMLATKVRYGMGEGFGEGRNHIHQREGLSRRWIMKACEDSLRRLQVDHIDLYQVHGVDALVPIEETLSALTDLVRRGWVRSIGCSNFSAWRLMEALWASDRRNLERFVTLQPEYSLVSPTRANFERELQRVCVAYDVAVIPYSPLAGGLLTGKYGKDKPLPASQRASETAQRLTDTNVVIVDAVNDVATKRGIPSAQIALAWLLQTPGMTAPIVGANSPAQLADLLPATSLTLDAAEIAVLNEASAWPQARTDTD
jgi:aryl-alcohol dehydrogenase-like predicted oxidoreductase